MRTYIQLILPLHSIPTSMWGRCTMARLHVARSSMSSADSSLSLISPISLSSNFLLCLPLFLLPCSVIYIAPFLFLSPHHMPIPFQPSFLDFFALSPTLVPVVPLIRSLYVHFQIFSNNRVPTMLFAIYENIDANLQIL